MSIRYIQSGDEPAGSLLAGGQIDDGADSWWAGAQCCFARVALAAAVTASTLSAAIASNLQKDPEEIPAGSLLKFSSPDEDSWDNPLNPISTTNFVKLPYLPDPEEIPAGSLHGPIEDEYWQNPAQTVCRLPYVAGRTNPTYDLPPTIYQPLPYSPDPEEIPAGKLLEFSTPDEDFWRNPLNPISTTNFLPRPYLPDPSDEPAQFHWIELDWYADPTATSTVGYNIYRGTAGPGSEGSTPINPSPVDVGAAPNSLCTYNDCNIQWGVTYWYVVYSYDTSTGTQATTPTNEISASYPPTWIDEDFWQNPVAPAPPSVYQPLPIGAGESAEIVPAVVFQPDEDFWINPVAPVPPTTYQRLPYPATDVEELPAGSLYGQPDEDFWQNPVAPVPASIYQKLPVLPDLSDEPAGSLHGQFDEDFWANPVAPVPPCGPKPSGGGPPALYGQLPYLPEVSDEPAGSLHGQFDEDFWVNPVAPIPATVYQRLPYLPELSDEAAGSLYGQPDEDFWANPVAPVPPSVYQRLPYASPDPEEVPAGSLTNFNTPDEDYWQNPVAPAPPSVYQPLPIAAGESAEIVPALVFLPDEDYWINPVAPVPPSVYQRLPYASPDPEEVSAGSLVNFKMPDEDYWPPYAVAKGGMPPLASAAGGAQGLVTVVPPSICQHLPFLPEVSDEPAGSLYGQPDEDFWANPVAPVPPTIFQRLPYLPDLSDDPAGSLHILTEETEWLNWVAPVGASVCQPLPSAWGFDDFSSFWWTSRWGVNTHSMARERISFSTDRERTSHSTARTRASKGVSRQTSL